MASVKKIQQIVAKRFPESDHQITELYHKSEFFRSICEDYIDCLQTIERLKSSKKQIKKNIKKEYELLLQDIENELVSNLRQFESIVDQLRE